MCLWNSLIASDVGGKEGSSGKSSSVETPLGGYKLAYGFTG
jgi:hypothetical protein